MKKIFTLLSYFIIIFNNNILFADYQTTIYTPANQVVPDTWIHTPELADSTIDDLNDWVADHYPNAIRLEDASRKYNCHAYAWHMTEGGNKVWLGRGSTTAEDIYWEGTANSGPCYVSTGISYNRKVRYNNADHSAVVAPNTTTFFISKWGRLPKMFHEPNYTPYTYSSFTYYKPTPNPSVTITGPTYLNYNQVGTFTANVSGGVTPFAYTWEKYRYCSGGSKAPCNYWFTIPGSSTAQTYDNFFFQLKATVKDARNISDYDYHFVEVGVQKSVKTNDNSGFELIPNDYCLLPNNPNPFNPITSIKFSLPEISSWTLTIYNLKGNRINEFTEEYGETGIVEIVWDGKDINNDLIASGTYIYILEANSLESDKTIILRDKMVFLK